MRIPRHGELKKCPKVTQLGSRRGSIQCRQAGSLPVPQPLGHAEMFHRVRALQATWRGDMSSESLKPSKISLWSKELLYYPSYRHHPTMALTPTAYCSTPVLGTLGYQKLPEQNRNRWRNHDHKPLPQQFDSARPCSIHCPVPYPQAVEVQHAFHAGTPPG